MMILALFFLPLVLSNVEEGSIYTVDVDTILKAFGAPQCMRQCIDPFIDSLDGLWHIRDVAQSMERVCKSHDEARECLKKVPYCDTFHVFGTASESFAHRCDKQVMLVRRSDSCLRQKADPVLKQCDAACHCRSNITSFAEHSSIKMAAQLGGNVFMASEQIGGLCGCLSCAIPCVTKGLNAVCPSSGWITLDAILQPFESISESLNTISPGLVDIVRTKLDPKCHFTIDSDKLKSIRKGDFSVLV